MNLNELFDPNEFAPRHLSFGDEAALLSAVGEKSMADFVDHTVPQSIRMPSGLNLPDALTEETLRSGNYAAVYACGPAPMLAYVKQISEKAGIPCWISME